MKAKSLEGGADEDYEEGKEGNEVYDMMNDFNNNNEEIITRPSVGDIVNELDKIIDIDSEQQ